MSNRKTIIAACVTGVCTALAVTSVFMYLTSVEAAKNKEIREVSFSHDWDADNKLVTLFHVPEDRWLVLTDVCAYWWGLGPSQRVYLYQDKELRASFVATSRGFDSSSNYNAFPSCFSSARAGVSFAPGSEVRVVPSTTFLSVTAAGFLE